MSNSSVYFNGPVFVWPHKHGYTMNISRAEEPGASHEPILERLDEYILHCTAARAALLKHIGDNAGAREARGSVVNELIAAQRAANSANERVLEILKVIITFEGYEAQQSALEDWSAWRQ